MDSEKKKADELVWNVPIPDFAAPLILIMSPKPRERKRALILSSRPVGIMTHWWNRRTIKCTSETGSCEACGHAARRYKQYLAGWDKDGQRYVLIEITHQAATDNRALLGENGPDLRGYDVVMSRGGNAYNSPLILELNKRATLDMSEVPEPFEVPLALMRIWAGATRVRKKPAAEEVMRAPQDEEIGDVPLPPEEQGF